MRFDTLDKKPKLWNIAAASAAAAAAAAVLFLVNPAGRDLLLGILLIVYLAVVIAFLVRGFFRQIRYNPYSYNVIYYSGFAVFLLSILITHIVALAQYTKAPDVDLTHIILGTLAFSPINYVLYSSPFILVLSIALFVSNVSLLRHERKRLVNFLGILLAFMLVGGMVFLFLRNSYVSGSFEEVVVYDVITTLLSAFYLYFECMIIGSIAANAVVVQHKPAYGWDFIIILGCGIMKDGTPTPLLKGRIDRALLFYRQQLESTGRKAVFVPSGGQGSDECISESACMKQYLLENGIPETQIIMEDQSASTFENMKYSKEKIMAANPEGKVLFSTNNYHIFRSGLFARRVKMRAQGIGCRTKWYFWPNALVREFVGMLTQHRGKQVLILLSMIVIYVLLVLLYHQVL